MRLGYILTDSGIPLYGTKGASVHVRELVRALAQQHAVDLFCVSQGDGHYDLPVRNLCVSTPGAISADDPASARDRRRIAAVEAVKADVDRACHQEKYDMLYERYSLFSDVGAAMSDVHDVPFLLEVNAPLIAERERVEPLPLAARAHAVERAVFRRADAVLAVSRAMAEYARDIGTSPDRVHVVPNGVDTGLFAPGMPASGARKRIGLEGSFVIGFVGSLKAWHGVDLLLEAFSRVAREGWRLLVVGQGPERERLEAQARALGRDKEVVFTGPVPHSAVPRYLAAMHVTVAPYRAVPDFYFSPLKLFEYLAAGRPVVASEIGQIAEVIQHGENGYLVSPDDVQALASALERLADDDGLRKKLARRAPEGLVTWQQTAERVTAIAGAIGTAGTVA